MSTAIASTDQAAAWARRLEDRRAARAGGLRDARVLIARETGVPVGTLENLRRGRLKQVAAWVLVRIRDAMIRDLQSEIEALNHELLLVRQGRVERDLDEVAEIEAHLASARRLISEGRGR